VLWSDFKRAAAVNTNWPLHRLTALDDLKAECLRRGLWREEGNHVRRGPFPPPSPDVDVRVLSVDDDGDGRAFLKIEPLHAPAVVYETGDAEPTPASSPVPTPARFEATGLRYRFLAYDTADPERVSVVKEWTARLRLKFEIHDRGDHFEVELLALPRANGISIRYTTDGSAPSGAQAGIYDGPIRVPEGCRVIRAMAVAGDYNLNSEVLPIQIPQRGEEDRGIDPHRPARWKQHIKLDETGQAWDYIQRLSSTPGVIAHEISFTGTSANGLQSIEFSGALDSGYDGQTMRDIADKIQELAQGDSLRMTVGAMVFPTGQALLDWLQATKQPFNIDKVEQ